MIPSHASFSSAKETVIKMSNGRLMDSIYRGFSARLKAILFASRGWLDNPIMHEIPEINELW